MADGHGAEHAALVALLRTRPAGMTWADVAVEVLAEGSALAVWDRVHPQALLALPGEDDALEAAARDLEEWATEGMTVLGIADLDYPERLRGVHQAPPILFTRGALRGDDPAVSVVGSRQASPRGLAIAAQVAEELVRLGLTVLSGLAAGIDAAAHRAALDAGGRTVALIGTGLRVSYPTANRALQAEIAHRGLLVSQFWPDAPPQRRHFLLRNAAMSGYGLATVVIEAGEQSGARAQARMAVEHGRPVILTALVVDRNEWARALVGRPGVHVAHSIGDVVSAVEDLRASATAVEDALRRLVDA